MTQQYTYIPNTLTALHSLAAVFHQGNEYSVLGIDAAHVEKGVTGIISPVPVANLSVLLFVRTALAFQAKEKCISILTEPLPRRILPHKATYKYRVLCRIILDYLQSDSQLIYAKTSVCSVDSVLWLYCLWALHSYFFVDYCHLDFNIMICKPP